MSLKPTSLTAVAKLIGDTLENVYDIDPVPLFDRVGLDTSKLHTAGARYPRAQILQLWELAAKASADPCIGVVAGLRIRPTTYYSLGFSFLTSHTLLGALRRLCRYHSIIASVPLKVEITSENDEYLLTVDYTDPDFPAPPIALDSFLASIIQLGRAATTDEFSPIAVSLNRPASGNEKRYLQAYGVAVNFSAGKDALHFDRETLEARLPGDNVIVAQANDAVTDNYLRSLDVDDVASEVRKLLLQMLPSGKVDRVSVAHRLNRSTSTLGRQLKDEGIAYTDLLEDTRRSLAEAYIEQRKYSLSEIAYLLGFSDQSNFSRAFKRWTGKSPGSYRASG
jgi:AraC-like DNA-binding protein